jgi:disulfide bond formation protein DsbB
MIIWQGGGILAVLIPVGAFVATWLGLDFVMGEAWEKAHPGWVGASLTLAGIVVWLLGRKWNGAPLDPETRQAAARSNQHTLFFIPMEYAAIFWVPVGVFLFFNLK